MDTTEAVAWDMGLIYRMVRERYHVLTDRQGILQSEQEILSKQLDQLRAQIEQLGNAIAIVEKAGGDAQNLRSQIGTAHVEKRRIEPRYDYLVKTTAIIAANLRLLGQAHDALHWLKFENRKLIDFDQRPEVRKPPVVSKEYIERVRHIETVLAERRST